MRSFINLAGVFLAGTMLLLPVMAQDDDKLCKYVSGTGTWTLIPSPNDTLGRVLGPTTGSLKSTVSAYLTNLTPLPSGALTATSVEIWAVDPGEEAEQLGRRPDATQDLIFFDGNATFTPIANQPIGTVQDTLKLTVTGGTGVYAGANGSIDVIGTGYNVFGPNAAPGNTVFKIIYRGKVCRAR